MNEIAWRAQKMMHDANIAGSEDYVAHKSRDNNVKIIKETAIGKVLENVLTTQSTEETRLIADIILRSLESVQKIGQIVGTAMIK